MSRRRGGNQLAESCTKSFTLRQPEGDDSTSQENWLKRVSCIRRHARRHRQVLISLPIFVAIVLTAVFADHVAPHDPNAQELSRRLLPPSWAAGGSGDYFLGADQVGRDILSRLFYGGRVSLVVGVAAVFFGGILGSALGIAAGFYGGLLDEIVMRVVDVQLSIPFILFAIAFMAIVGTSTLNLILVLVVYGWTVYARLLRAQVLAEREKDYITAQRAIGSSNLRIMARHILPNVAKSIIVVSTLEIANMIILEAGLSYLGLGVDPGTPSWGTMLSDGRDYVSSAWWLATFPGVAISITVLSINLIGDWLRDLLDPQMRF